MRATCGAFLVAAALAAVACPAGAAPPAPRALIAFLPARDALEVLAGHPELSLGLTSPTLGGYTPEQMALDIGQGARVSSRVYSPRKPPAFRVEVGGGSAEVRGWASIVRRARGAPADIVPGLLASTVERAGGSVAYAGVDGGDPVALAAADRAGAIGRFSASPAPGFAARALALWRPRSLLVARLPAGGAGARALDRVLAARRPGDLVFVAEAPPREPLTLLATGVVGAGIGGGVVRSDTTRRDGLVAATDASATVLRALGIATPKKMQGERIESRAAHGAGYVRRLGARLDSVLSHRAEAVRAVAASWALLVLVLWLARRRRGLEQAARIVFLGAIWVPALALLTAAIEPSGLAESLVLALGALALGALTDALLPWPAAPLLPAAVSFGAHALDLALGSHLIGLSIAGPNPKGGSRFFGVGNELEIILAVTVLIGAGAALALRPPREAPRGFALASLVAALVVGAGRLGADVGGVITIAAGGAAAVVMSLPGGPTRRAIALAVLVPLLAVGALILLDLAIGGGAHLTRMLSSSGGPGDLGEVALRRWRLSVTGITHGTTPLSLGVAIALLAVGVAKRRELLAPLGGERTRPFRAAVVGAFFATVIGALVNDSGPIIVLIGTISLALVTAYVHSRTEPALDRELG